MSDEYGIIEEVSDNDDIEFEVKLRMRKEGDIELDVDAHGNQQPSLSDILFTLTVSKDILLQEYYKGIKTEVDNAV